MGRIGRERFNAIVAEAMGEVTLGVPEEVYVKRKVAPPRRMRIEAEAIERRLRELTGRKA
ncbi:MAG: hypothetical protein ACREC5_02835 [Thermoplasmata archaeon]